MTDVSGNIQAQYKYDPYGNASKISGSLSSDFGYAGYYDHRPSNLCLTANRAYRTVLGRWIKRDPIGEAGGHNLYRYSRNAPTNYLDSLGLNCVPPSLPLEWGNGPTWGDGPVWGFPPPEQQPPVIQDPRFPPIPPPPTEYPEPDPNAFGTLPNGDLVAPILGDPGFWVDVNTGVIYYFDTKTGNYETLPGMSPGQLPDTPFEDPHPFV